MNIEYPIKPTVSKVARGVVIETNKIVKNSFRKHSGRDHAWEPATYFDQRTLCARRVFKGYLQKSAYTIWKNVLEDLKEAGSEGWELYYHSGGAVGGIKRYEAV